MSKIFRKGTPRRALKEPGRAGLARRVVVKRRDKWVELMKLLGGAKHLENEGYFDLAAQLRADARTLFDELIAGILGRNEDVWEEEMLSGPEPATVSAGPVNWVRPEAFPHPATATAAGPVSYHWSAAICRDQACG